MPRSHWRAVRTTGMGLGLSILQKPRKRGMVPVPLIPLFMTFPNSLSSRRPHPRLLTTALSIKLAEVRLHGVV